MFLLLIEWELKEQFNSGVNPDYGVPTPTLVSPPKRPSRQSGQFFLFLTANLIFEVLNLSFEVPKTFLLA